MTSSQQSQGDMGRTAQPWEASYQAMMDGLRQTQEFWANLARTWSGGTFTWPGQARVSEEGFQTLRELQDASFAVSQAWLRLPLVLLGTEPVAGLPDALMRLTEAQTNAYQVLADIARQQARPSDDKG